MSDLPGKRSTFDLIAEQLKHLPELVEQLKEQNANNSKLRDIEQKRWREEVEFRQKTHQRLENLERAYHLLDNRVYTLEKQSNGHKLTPPEGTPAMRERIGVDDDG